jgi:hypothetical protein
VRDPVVGAVLSWLWSSLLELSVLEVSVRKLARDRLRSSLKLRNAGAIAAQMLDQKLVRLEESFVIANLQPLVVAKEAMSGPSLSRVSVRAARNKQPPPLWNAEVQLEVASHAWVREYEGCQRARKNSTSSF